jgi:C-terminal peptidase prc
MQPFRYYMYLFVLLLAASSLSACDIIPTSVQGMVPAATPAAEGATTVASLATTQPTDAEERPLTYTRTPRPTRTTTATRTPRPTRTATPLASPTATVVATPTPLSQHSRQRLFEKVWQTIDEHYLYDDFRGTDWDAVWVEFAPRVETVSDNEAFFDLMTEMVNRLDDHHSRFLAPNDAVEETALTVGREMHVGIGVITAPSSDGAIIQHVFSDSPAAQAGLRPRDRIVAVNGSPFAAGSDITGLEGTRVRLTVARPDEQIQDVVLTRRHVEGRISPIARRLAADIGYIRIPTLWVNDMADQVSGALTDLVVEKPLNGLIVDLRGNPGGWRDVLTSVLGHFVRGQTGEFFSRHDATSLTIRESSGPDLRHLPLVVLIDQQTASYAEVLAAVLQAEDDAYVIGMPSAGNTETIYAYELTGGARLWVAQEGFRLRDGRNLEGQGVIPDVLIDAEWTRYSEEKDPHILAALRYLQER